jgi:hypothetical protein
MGVHILHPRQTNLRVTTNVSKKRLSAIFDDPNIDWLSVQKDIVTQFRWMTDFNDTDFAGWTYSGKAVSRYMGVPTYIHYRWYELPDYTYVICFNAKYKIPVWQKLVDRQKHLLFI